jgi:squalene cyclase
VALRFDNKEVSHYKVPVMTTDRVVLSSVLAELILRQLPCGGWAALASSSQPALEPTCFSALALGSLPGGVLGRAQEFLLHTQNPNGSWPAFAGDDTDGAWVTSLAVMALRDVVAAIPARLQGVHWLMSCAGREGNWFWKWKFRTTDRHVRFDPDKFGWPWFPDTISWVVPTAFAVLALNQLACSCGGLEQVPFRVERGIEMLLDRACPGGGWNAGNGVVYGAAVAAHADDTAIALLALSGQNRDPVVESSVQYLERIAPTLSAPWSLAWAILALAAYGRPIDSLYCSLVALPELPNVDDTSTLALVCLALDHQRALSALGVTS